MKRKTLAVCSSVALMQLFAGMMFLTGGCASTSIEEETMPKGAYVPETKHKEQKAPAVDEPPVQEPAAPVKEAAFDPNVKENVTPPPLPPTAEKKSGETYIVKRGDSVWKISRMYGISEKELLAYNPKLNPNKIRVGQKIVLPAGAKYNPAKAVKVSPKAAKRSAKNTVAVPSGNKHVVKKGDNLSKIAVMYKVKRSDLAALNGLDENKPIRIGQTLLIPKGGKTAVKSSKTSSKKSVKKTDVKKDVKKTDDKRDEETQKEGDSEPSVPQTPAVESTPATESTVDPAAPAVPADTPASAAPAPAPAADATNAALPVAKNYKQVVDVDTTIDAFAAKQGATVEEIRRKNPQLKGDMIPAGTEVTLP